MAERFTLVLSGGSALGAYQAGAWQALDEAGLSPDRIVAASIGAVNAAIVLGNPPGRQIAALDTFWRRAAQYQPVWQAVASLWGDGRARALQSPLMGSPAVFRPRLPGALSLLPGMPGDSGLFDLAPLRRSLRDLIDFDRLNAGPTRLTVGATDIETGEEVRFDTAEMAIGPDHILASCGFLPFFPPVEVDGRLLGDGALSANLPLEAALEDEPEDADRFILAIDLIRRRSGPPRTVGQAVDRQLELLLSDQTRRTLRHVRQSHALHRRDAATTVLVLIHDGVDQDSELRPFDYSAKVLGARWTAGRRDLSELLAAEGRERAGPDGLRIRVRTADGALEEA